VLQSVRPSSSTSVITGRPVGVKSDSSKGLALLVYQDEALRADLSGGRRWGLSKKPVWAPGNGK